MAPAKKVVSTVEISEDNNVQEQITKMMVILEASMQQAAAASRALAETRVKLTVKITELQRENQYLKDA